MKNGKSQARIIDADGHVRETDAEIIEYMSAGYRSRRDAHALFPADAAPRLAPLDPGQRLSPAGLSRAGLA